MINRDNHIFTLRFAMVDSDNNYSWQWFFKKLRHTIDDREELVIILDQMSSISKIVAIVYPNAHHGIYMQHLFGNLKSMFKGIVLDLFILTL